MPERAALPPPCRTSQLPVQIRGEGKGIPDESGRSLIGKVAEAIYTPESAKNALAFHKEGLAGHRWMPAKSVGKQHLLPASQALSTAGAIRTRSRSTATAAEPIGKRSGGGKAQVAQRDAGEQLREGEHSAGLQVGAQELPVHICGLRLKEERPIHNVSQADGLIYKMSQGVLGQKERIKGGIRP